MSETESQFISYVMGWGVLVMLALLFGKFILSKNTKSEQNDEEETW